MARFNPFSDGYFTYKGQIYILPTVKDQIRLTLFLAGLMEGRFNPQFSCNKYPQGIPRNFTLGRLFKRIDKNQLKFIGAERKHVNKLYKLYQKYPDNLIMIFEKYPNIRSRLQLLYPNVEVFFY